jgi:predicted transcriptional regulator
MAKEMLLTVRMDAELHKAFMEAAHAVDRHASQIARDLVRDFVNRQRGEAEHDAWFRTEIEAGLRETQFVPHEQVEAEMAREEAALMKRK